MHRGAPGHFSCATGAQRKFSRLRQYEKVFQFHKKVRSFDYFFNKIAVDVRVVVMARCFWIGNREKVQETKFTLRLTNILTCGATEKNYILRAPETKKVWEP